MQGVQIHFHISLTFLVRPIGAPYNHEHSKKKKEPLHHASILFLFPIKEVPLDGVLSTQSSQNRGILKDTVPKSNLPGHGSPLSRSGSYLGTLEKSHDQNESLGFHCSFETDGSSGQEIDIPCTQPVSHDKILEGRVLE